MHLLVTKVVYTKESIVKTAKMLFSIHNPDNSDLFEYKFFTNKEMYETVTMQMPKLSSVCTQQQFSLLLNDQKEHFGTLNSKKYKQITKRGRYLYAMKQAVHGKNNGFSK